jgi:hypothetical protein
MHVFLDCDGVLADFDRYAESILGLPPREYERQKHNNKQLWDILYAHDDYFYKLPKMPDADELVEGVKALGFDPVILTGIPSKEGSDWAIGQKTRWAEKHFPDLDIICCKSKEKALHMIQGHHNVLIDDWAKYKHIWEETGGTFILHTSANDSLAKLCVVLDTLFSQSLMADAQPRI